MKWRKNRGGEIRSSIFQTKVWFDSIKQSPTYELKLTISTYNEANKCNSNIIFYASQEIILRKKTKEDKAHVAIFASSKIVQYISKILNMTSSVCIL